MLPREMQSISWEAIRLLFTATFKSNAASVNAVRDLWTRYTNGEATYEETIEAIVEFAGGFRDPPWIGVKPSSAAAPEDGATSYESKLPVSRDGLPERGRPGRGDGGVPGRALPAGDVALDETLEQSAYHGTPHNVDRFSTDHIGTGEGAQAYGWGLYFAEDPAVAGYYHRALAEAPRMKSMKLGSMLLNERNNFDYSARASVNNVENIRASLAENIMIAENEIRGQDFREAVLKILDDKIEGYRTEWPEGVRAAEQLRQMLAAPGALKIEYYEAEGGVYQVDIPDAEVANFLLWDAPMSAQPETVRQALLRAFDRDPKVMPATLGELTGELFYRELAESQGGDEAASMWLADAGIKGLKYFDGNSRGSDDARTHNLVVFDDSIIQITHKDGKPLTQAERDTLLQSLFQEQENRPAPARGGYNPRDSILTLLNAADLSTFLHEAGHYFFEADITLAETLLRGRKRG